ncbi:uncharacterized protein [Procambarus clarkii]|uniref:uncharacterized protein isoform X1 n=1 Tax=Procambarus clarkii TaxID=6728 RepID=UPI0037436F4B
MQTAPTINKKKKVLVDGISPPCNLAEIRENGKAYFRLSKNGEAFACSLQKVERAARYACSTVSRRTVQPPTHQSHKYQDITQYKIKKNGMTFDKPPASCNQRLIEREVLRHIFIK